MGIAGWWYVWIHGLTGAWTGQFQDVHVSVMPLEAKVRAAVSIPWLRALDTVLLSHIWFGGWSFLQLRSWMYHFIYAIFAIAGLGLIRRQGREALVPAAYLVMLTATLAYHVLVTFLANGIAATNGWYLYGAAFAETTLISLGLLAWNRYAIPAVVTLFVLLDLYGANLILLPYYLGVTAHNAAGSCAPSIRRQPRGALRLTVSPTCNRTSAVRGHSSCCGRRASRRRWCAPCWRGRQREVPTP